MTIDTIEFLGPPQITRLTQYEGEQERRVSNWITYWDFEEPIDVGIVGVPLFKGSVLPVGVDSTPNAIRKAMVYCTTYNPDLDVDIQSLKTRHIGDIALHVSDVLENHRRIETAFSGIFGLADDMVTVIVGGNGSITAPIVRAYAEANQRKVGIIHFDSKVDSRHLAEAGPSDSTTVRAILEADIGVSGEQVFHIGSHGFLSSMEERRWTQDQGVTLVTARQARKEGINEVVERALDTTSRDTNGIYVSVDGTVLDITASGPALGAAPGGLSLGEMEESLFLIGQNPKVKALDLVGIDTSNDARGVIARTSLGLLLAFLAGVKTRG